MNINSGIILGKKRQAIISKAGSLFLVGSVLTPLRIIETGKEIQFLTASPDGEHFAFWSYEQFHLMNVTGAKVWSRRIDTDKAAPHGIHFSTSGDAVAFIDDYDSGHRIHFGNIKERLTTGFGPSGPIGYDADLQYFVAPAELQAGYYIDTVGAGLRIFAEKMSGSPIDTRLALLDRHYNVQTYLAWPFQGWRSVAIQSGANGFVVLRDGSLLWLSIDSVQSEVVIADCIPKDEWNYYYTLSVDHEIALIQITRRTPWWDPPKTMASVIMVNRNMGVVWKGADVLSATLNGPRAVIHHKSGIIEVVRGDGSVEISCAPPSWKKTLAANVVDNILRVAYVSEADQAITFKDYTLSQK